MSETTPPQFSNSVELYQHDSWFRGIIITALVAILLQCLVLCYVIARVCALHVSRKKPMTVEVELANT